MAPAPRLCQSARNDSIEMANVTTDTCDSPPGTPITGSPAKARMRMDSPASVIPEVSQLSLSPGPHSAQSDSIAMLPTTNQPVMDTTLKEMLISLRKTLQSDMQQFRQNVTSLGDRMSHVETQRGACASTVNELIDAQADHNDEHNWIKDKEADLEDRSRRNNIKIRGISEEIQTQDLTPYARSLIKAMLPELKNMELVIDRMYRLPKPSHLIHVILCIHFHVKN